MCALYWVFCGFFHINESERLAFYFMQEFNSFDTIVQAIYVLEGQRRCVAIQGDPYKSPASDVPVIPSL
jgi:hypothetical protein